MLNHNVGVNVAHRANNTYLLTLAYCDEWVKVTAKIYLKWRKKEREREGGAGKERGRETL